MSKRKLTAAQKAAKKRRKQEYMTVFINGKQQSVRRDHTVEGLSVDECIRWNADLIWLLQEGMYAELYEWEMEQNRLYEEDAESGFDADSEDIPF